MSCLDRGIGDDLVHCGSESFEQEGVTVEIVAEQLRAAIAVGQTQHGGLASAVLADRQERRP